MNIDLWNLFFFNRTPSRLEARLVYMRLNWKLTVIAKTFTLNFNSIFYFLTEDVAPSAVFGITVLSLIAHGQSVFPKVDQQWRHTYPDIQSELASRFPNCPQQPSTVCR